MVDALPVVLGLHSVPMVLFMAYMEESIYEYTDLSCGAGFDASRNRIESEIPKLDGNNSLKRD
jgi:hypothetical protein